MTAGSRRYCHGMGFMIFFFLAFKDENVQLDFDFKVDGK